MSRMCMEMGIIACGEWKPPQRNLAPQRFPEVVLQDR